MFSKRLKELRLEKGITQVQLSKALNVTKATVNDWKKGKYETSFETLIKIAKYLEVSTDYILVLED